MPTARPARCWAWSPPELNLASLQVVVVHDVAIGYANGVRRKKSCTLEAVDVTAELFPAAHLGLPGCSSLYLMRVTGSALPAASRSRLDTHRSGAPRGTSLGCLLRRATLWLGSEDVRCDDCPPPRLSVSQ